MTLIHRIKVENGGSAHTPVLVVRGGWISVAVTHLALLLYPILYPSRMILEY